MNIENSKLIWGYRGRFDREEGSSPFYRGGGVVRFRGVIKEKSPQFHVIKVGKFSTLTRYLGREGPGEGNIDKTAAKKTTDDEPKARMFFCLRHF